MIHGEALKSGRLTRLQDEQRRLAVRMTKLESEIEKLSALGKRRATGEEIDRWMDALSQGIGELPPLPMDFSRADLYEDHD
jgi:hypothetical protein